MPDVMIKVDGLTRVYAAHKGGAPAVDHVSFEVSRGDVLGFLGPNGAGKSTTMKMLTCYLPPTSGQASVAGYDVFEQPLEVRRRIGYLPEDTPLYKDMTVLGYLMFAAQMRGIPRGERTDRIRQVGKTTGILDVVGKYVGELSRGYRQRVGLTQALLHDPEVLILDEPTSGLDPNQIVEIRELIREIGATKTIILSTHILPEVQATCNRVLIINDGKLVADGKPDELVSRDSDRYRVLFGDSDAELTRPAPDAAVAAVSAIDGVADVVHSLTDDGALALDVTADGPEDLRLALFRLASSEGWPLIGLDRREASLEEVFGRLTKQEAAA